MNSKNTKLLITILFVAFFMAYSCKKKTKDNSPIEDPLPEVSLSVSIPQSSGNTHADAAAGFVTNSFQDGAIKKDSVMKLTPKFLRWGEGKIHFDKSNPNAWKIGIHDASAWWFSYINGNSSTWTSTPSFSFDSFITLCKQVGAQPVVIIGIQAIYDGTNVTKMSRSDVIQSAIDFVAYANITKKYGVKYWEIGNEDDLEGASTSTYASIFNELVPKLKTVDATIQCGANYMSGSTGWNTLIPLVKANADFLVTHCYSWLNQTQYADWYPKEAGLDWDYAAKDATNAIDSNSGAPKSLFLTEISSFSPGSGGDENTSNGASNITWKGLHNIQMNLDALSRKYTAEASVWNTRWDDNSAISYNIFSSSYKPTPMGLSIATYGNHLYNNLGQKTVSSSGYVTLWVSHNNSKNMMSVFLLNRDQSQITVTVTINGYTGNYNNEKWVYKGSSPTSTDATLKKVASQSISSNTFSVKLDPLSVTVIDFNTL